ncbi:MAG: extradiol ring-cleavage dioxygenase [Dehalococcoidia bacterium]
MAEILGIGVTHYPLLLGPPEQFADLMRGVLNSKRIPAEAKEPSNWPSAMQAEYENEVEAAHIHQAQHIAAFKKVRERIDEFNPDAVIVWGDDQYENFVEDLVPPFNVYCMDDMPTEPFYRKPNNVWGSPTDTTMPYKGAGQLAKTLAYELVERDFPIPYSYKNLHFDHGLTHAFANALVYLDWDQKGGFPYPLVPIAVNCYGRGLISTKGGTANLARDADTDPWLHAPGPSGPTPASCFRLGQLVREILEEQGGRYVVMASSGWSHAFLTEKHNYLWPDQAFDRQRFDELKAGDQRQWKGLSNDDIYDAGAQEFKNWICLAGAMEERTPTIVEYLETWIFNSEKCWAIFEP